MHFMHPKITRMGIKTRIIAKGMTATKTNTVGAMKAAVEKVVTPMAFMTDFVVEGSREKHSKTQISSMDRYMNRAGSSGTTKRIRRS